MVIIKMKEMIIICVFVALSLSISHASSESDEDSVNFEEDLSKMSQIAERDEVINGIFKPMKQGSLGFGGFSFIWKGGLLMSRTHVLTIKEVAMKFTPSNDEHFAIKEYEMYTYLNAINNTNVELYGIPSVYYFGRWDSYVLMGISLLDTTSDRIFKTNKINELDVLIMFREFTRVSKYIHSRCICHNDMKLDNLMFWKNQGFIIAKKMYNKEKALRYLSDTNLERGKKCAGKDWSDFLASICRMAGIQFYPDEILYELTDDVAYTMTILNNYGNPILRRVFVEFANYAFDYDTQSIAAGVPFHDQFYQFIFVEIEKLRQRRKRPALVSWLKGERDGAPLDISSINEPL